MLRILGGLPANVLGVEATGTVTDADYEGVLVPEVKRKREAHERIRFVYVFREDFAGWTTGAVWQDAKLGLKDPTAWEKIAVVTDEDWLRHTVEAFGWMVPGDVRCFELDELRQAEEWAAS